VASVRRWSLSGRSLMLLMIWGFIVRRCASVSGRPKPTAARGGDIITSQEREEIRKLRRENFELPRENEILKSASVFFAKELDPDRPK
jgi:transposase-like protein